MSNRIRIAIVLFFWVFFTSAAAGFNEFWQAMAWIILCALLCVIGLGLIVDTDLDS